MTIKEAIIQSLTDLGRLADSVEVCNHIIAQKYSDFAGRTPASTVSAQLGDFIRNGDARVKRVKKPTGNYLYYLTKYETQIGVDGFDSQTEQLNKKERQVDAKKIYEERSLHKLLSSYLKNTEVYSKTIFHEQSNGKDSNQIWTHPDMVGIKFLNLHTKTSQNFLKTVNRVDSFKLSSYELKREITSDSELKKAFFQAVSNSSWANYGYLVALEFNDNLYEEMSRLNQSFGIGIIKLTSNPYQSKILFPARYRDLDFSTIDKLCKINEQFEKFIEQVEKLLTAEERYYRSTEKELSELCDSYFLNDNEFEEYCRKHFIPTE